MGVGFCRQRGGQEALDGQCDRPGRGRVDGSKLISKQGTAVLCIPQQQSNQQPSTWGSRATTTAIPLGARLSGEAGLGNGTTVQRRQAGAQAGEPFREEKKERALCSPLGVGASLHRGSVPMRPIHTSRWLEIFRTLVITRAHRPLPVLCSDRKGIPSLVPSRAQAFVGSKCTERAGYLAECHWRRRRC
jgi:hypothetical protein